MAQFLLMLKLCFIVFALRVKSSLADWNWALCSSSTGPLPDDDSKHGWVVFKSRLLCSTYRKKRVRLLGNTHTHTSHTSSGRNSTEKNNTYTKKEKCEEAVSGSKLAILHTLVLVYLHMTLDFVHRMVLNTHTPPLNIQSKHESSVAYLFIFTPTRPVNTHMHSYFYAKRVNPHTYCVLPYNATQWYICMCTGTRGLEELCVSTCC